MYKHYLIRALDKLIGVLIKDGFSFKKNQNADRHGPKGLNREVETYALLSTALEQTGYFSVLTWPFTLH